MSPPYPWQVKQWEAITARDAAGTLPHALLLTGEAGLGKKAFAQALAKLLLCESKTQCAPCPACQLLASQHHPDLIQVALRDKEKSIGVENIREMLPQCYESALYGKNKVVLISDAELLNNAACNALLKTLEEPEHNIYFILVCDSVYQLPQTLRSRCQIMRFYAGDDAATLAWLQSQTAESGIAAALYLTQGAPLLALDWLKNKQLEIYQQIWSDAASLLIEKQEPLRIAEKWQTQSTITILNALHWLWVFALQNPTSIPATDPYLATLAQRGALLRQQKTRYQLGQDYAILLELRRLAYQSVPFNAGMQMAALCLKLVKA